MYKRQVLHPGSHVKAGDEVGLQQIVKGLNEVLTPDQSVHIALETMAGKGSELGRDFDQLRYIIDNVEHHELLGVCLDTCHLHDAGYDLTKFDEILNEFDEKIGLQRLLVVHVNDSKNERGAHKDRHENIGYGHIGFETLNHIVHHPKLKDVPKILETPYILSLIHISHNAKLNASIIKAPCNPQNVIHIGAIIMPKKFAPFTKLSFKAIPKSK